MYDARSLVEPSVKEYEWVKKILRKHPKGLSPKNLVNISADERELGIRLRDRNPPSREKIYKILQDYAGKDWDYEVGGGRKKGSIVKLKEDGPLVGIGRKVKNLLISERIIALDRLDRKKSKRLPLKDIIELSKIKDVMLSYPASVFYNDSRHSRDREILFNSALGISKEQIAKIKRIEISQKKLNDKFDKTMFNLDKLKNSNLIEVEIYGNRNEHRDISLYRNTIRRMHGIRK